MAYEFSEHKSVSNTAAPGDLVRAHTTGYAFKVTDVVIYNAHGSTAVITLYDEDSNIKLVVSVGTAETAVLSFETCIKYGEHDIYARTDQATNAEVTVAGKELPPQWA